MPAPGPEASSLGDHSYPIEVGWVLEDGSPESHLIRPPPEWTDWDPGAERGDRDENRHRDGLIAR